ncbi:hypothetical protein RND81_14G175100 [Saponaria officinalis]|uniref:BAH domain-containing protein n=1 Tax=Saponaria officinalis TaxID=3572 RepID=A0AAW1GRS6_SAPOF
MDGEDIVKWGKILAHDGDYKMYRSYTYRGVEYNVYDSVYTFSAGSKETDIGKIMMITETKKVREVKISWFFRPRDICNFLREYKPCWNELFLACGAGKGLSSFVPLEAIIGKCNVICTSKDRRVPLQSKSDIEKADYFFSHAFDVGTRKLLRNLPDTIDCIKVERLLNPLIDEPKPKANVERPRVVIPGSRAEDAERRYSSDQLRTANVKLNEKESDVKEEAFRMLEQPVPENRALKRRKISEADSVYNLKTKE